MQQLYHKILKNIGDFLSLSTKYTDCGLKTVKKKFTIKLGMTDVENKDEKTNAETTRTRRERSG